MSAYGNSQSSALASPSKPLDFFKSSYHSTFLAPPSPPSAKSSAGKTRVTKPILDFADKGTCKFNSRHWSISHLLVPIYDGRYADFNPHTELSQVETLPLWKNGQEDAPRQSLAAVGYTVHAYPKRSGVTDVSMNLQWLVVLGTVGRDWWYFLDDTSFLQTL